MQQLILVLHILVTLTLITLVLFQHGKGADVGASLGSGAANTMFGSVGPASFLMKLTALLAAIFFATSIGFGYLLSHQQQVKTFDFGAAANTAQPATVVPAKSVGTHSKPAVLKPPLEVTGGKKTQE